MKLKKHAIGYNTVSSTNGVVSARGVKSKPNNIEIFGYTHEVGEGEKSPDNPYILQSLDSGNVNLYSEDKIIDMQVANDGTFRKGFSIEASRFKSKNCCVYFDLKESVGIVKNQGINIKFLYKNGQYETFTPELYINYPKKRLIPSSVEKVLIYESGIGGNGKFFELYKKLVILDSPLMPDEYITDEHSIVLYNGDTTMQVPTPIALNSINGISDYIYKDSNDGGWKLVRKIQKFVLKGTENFNMIKTDGGLALYLTVVFKYASTGNLICKSEIFNCTENKPSIKEHITQQVENSICFRYDPNNPLNRTMYIYLNCFSTLDDFKVFLSKQHENGQTCTIWYLQQDADKIVLSKHAQNLLNSFELQNNNEIFVEGYPNIRISGYMQK